MKSRSKQNHYSPIPFFVVRAISSISALIAASILAFFCQKLWSDGYKIPWTFIVVLLAALINLVFLIITSIISCCASLSPLINIVVNVPLLILWVLAISILTWNIYGTLGHTCSMTNWGNDRGVMVCQIYKTLYSCVVFANLSHIAQIVLDVRARRRQLGQGKYDQMRDSQDIKIDDLKPLAPNVGPDSAAASRVSLRDDFRDDHSPIQQFRDESPGWRPSQKPRMNHSESYASHTSNGSEHHTHRGMERYQAQDSSTSVHMQDFTGYQRPQPTPHYESSSYHTGYERQQDDYYQRRY